MANFVALLDHDDELAPTALYYVALALQNTPALQIIYSDEDKLDRQSRRSDPYFKSDWNPQLFLGQNFISHLGVYRTELVRQVGGFRVGFEGSQDYDLTLRCLEQITPAQIQHIPRVLYHWRTTDQSTASYATAKPYAQEAAFAQSRNISSASESPARSSRITARISASVMHCLTSGRWSRS